MSISVLVADMVSVCSTVCTYLSGSIVYCVPGSIVYCVYLVVLYTVCTW